MQDLRRRLRSPNIQPIPSVYLPPIRPKHIKLCNLKRNNSRIFYLPRRVPPSICLSPLAWALMDGCLGGRERKQLDLKLAKPARPPADTPYNHTTRTNSLA